HILSMFPDSPVLPALLDPAAEPACFAVPAGEQGRPPPQPRLSLNLPWLLRTDAVVLAITGPEKRRVFDRGWDADPVRAPLAALRAAGARRDVSWTEDSRSVPWSPRSRRGSSNGPATVAGTIWSGWTPPPPPAPGAASCRAPTGPTPSPASRRPTSC